MKAFGSQQRHRTEWINKVTAGIGGLPHGIDVKQIDDVVYRHLRERIVKGLRPGTPLRLREISDQLGVSTMPVRAALLRLESDGLAQKLPRRGTVVAPLSLADLEEIQAVRFGIEAFAGRLGVANLGSSHIASMRKLVDKLRKATPAQAGDRGTDAYLNTVRNLHHICYKASGRETLMKLVRSYEDSAERYIRLALLADTEAFESDTRLQEEFVDACESRDPDNVESTVRRNLQWTLDVCRPSLEAFRQ
jgi:GntR family transcriptional regulator, rspAB operon transcriptional repressor